METKDYFNYSLILNIITFPDKWWKKYSSILFRMNSTTARKNPKTLYLNLNNSQQLILYLSIHWCIVQSRQYHLS